MADKYDDINLESEEFEEIACLMELHQFLGEDLSKKLLINEEDGELSLFELLNKFRPSCEKYGLNKRFSGLVCPYYDQCAGDEVGYGMSYAVNDRLMKRAAALLKEAGREP